MAGFCEGPSLEAGFFEAFWLSFALTRAGAFAVWGTTTNCAPRVVMPIVHLNGIDPVSFGVNPIVVIASRDKNLVTPMLRATRTCAHPLASRPSILHSTGMPA